MITSTVWSLNLDDIYLARENAYKYGETHFNFQPVVLSLAASGKRAFGPSNGNFTDSGQESNKMTDSQYSLGSDGVQQRSFGKWNYI